ncbi:MAG TPA: hypothetical protein VHX44_02470 [Planctomycetota bacterium]|nr:hypothetical protein [Planctomycetota bacterium]
MAGSRTRRKWVRAILLQGMVASIILVAAEPVPPAADVEQALQALRL